MSEQNQKRLSTGETVMHAEFSRVIGQPQLFAMINFAMVSATMPKELAERLHDKVVEQTTREVAVLLSAAHEVPVARRLEIAMFYAEKHDVAGASESSEVYEGMTGFIDLLAGIFADIGADPLTADEKAKIVGRSAEQIQAEYANMDRKAIGRLIEEGGYSFRDAVNHVAEGKISVKVLISIAQWVDKLTAKLGGRKQAHEWLLQLGLMVLVSVSFELRDAIMRFAPELMPPGWPDKDQAMVSVEVAHARVCDGNHS